MRNFQRLLCLVLASMAYFCSGKSSPGSADRKPNILLIMTDDQGYGDLASHGNPLIKTPVQDRLAAEGCLD